MGLRFTLGGCLLVLFLVAGACSAEHESATSRLLSDVEAQGILREAQLTLNLENPNNKTNLFSLIPGRYPNAVSLGEFLESMPSLPGGEEALKIVIELIQNSTGVSIPEETVKLILADSSLLLNYFMGTPRELHQLWPGLNYVMPPDWNRTVIRIQSDINFPDDLESYPFDIEPFLPSISPLSPNSSIWFGFFMPKSTTKAQAKINLLTSFIFNQLSDNHHLQPSHPDWFVVKVKGQPYTRIDTFLNALLEEKASVSTYLTKRIAAFYGLYMKDQQGRLLEVADPLMIETGFYDPTGTKEVILPAIHSEFVIDLQMGSFNFNLVWYEGDDGIGFFPGNMYELESWVGTVNMESIKGPDCVTAVLYMSALRDILVQVAQKNKFWDWGYGITGVCDDSCGIIELIMANASTEYPNLMDKSFVVPEIMSRVRQRDGLSYVYYELLKIINNMPVDWRGEEDPTARPRAAGTIVWPVGEEPFQCVIDARAILGAN